MAATRELAQDKAQRIVEAMRVSVAARGIAGATFDQVAREAGVSRGLLHYYFATKERLLVEVVRRECEVRIERMEAAVAGAGSAEEVLAALVASFEELQGAGHTTVVMFYEMMTLAQRNADIATELAELGRRTRAAMAGACARGHRRACWSFAPTPRCWPPSCSRSPTGSPCASSASPSSRSRRWWRRRSPPRGSCSAEARAPPRRLLSPAVSARRLVVHPGLPSHAPRANRRILIGSWPHKHVWRAYVARGRR